MVDLIAAATPSSRTADSDSAASVQRSIAPDRTAGDARAEFLIRTSDKYADW
jgi:hypothetical protein